MDWGKAEEHLKCCESAYAEIGSAGLFAMRFTINPLRDRFNKGERTQELYNEIMEIAL
jgi:hypothetical protein